MSTSIKGKRRGVFITVAADEQALLEKIREEQAKNPKLGFVAAKRAVFKKHPDLRDHYLRAQAESPAKDNNAEERERVNNEITEKLHMTRVKHPQLSDSDVRKQMWRENPSLYKRYLEVFG